MPLQINRKTVPLPDEQIGACLRRSRQNAKVVRNEIIFPQIVKSGMRHTPSRTRIRPKASREKAGDEFRPNAELQRAPQDTTIRSKWCGPPPNRRLSSCWASKVRRKARLRAARRL